MKTAEVEAAVVWKRLRPLKNIVVANVSWSFFPWHEADLVRVTPAGYGTEVEIKVTKADLIADKVKRRWSLPMPNLIREMYFAGPLELEEAMLEHVPALAGIIVVEKRIVNEGERNEYPLYVTKVIRRPSVNKAARKWTPDEQQKLLRLAYLRYMSRAFRLEER